MLKPICTILLATLLVTGQAFADDDCSEKSKWKEDGGIQFKLEIKNKRSDTITVEFYKAFTPGADVLKDTLALAPGEQKHTTSWVPESGLTTFTIKASTGDQTRFQIESDKNRNRFVPDVNPLPANWTCDRNAYTAPYDWTFKYVIQ